MNVTQIDQHVDSLISAPTQGSKDPLANLCLKYQAAAPVIEGATVLLGFIKPKWVAYLKDLEAAVQAVCAQHGVTTL